MAAIDDDHIGPAVEVSDPPVLTLQRFTGRGQRLDVNRPVWVSHD